MAVDRPGDAVDVHPINLVSTASIAHLRAVTPGGDRLSRRPVSHASDGCGVHEEDTWGGRTVRVGQALLTVVGPVPRCVVTN